MVRLVYSFCLMLHSNLHHPHHYRSDNKNQFFIAITHQCLRFLCNLCRARKARPAPFYICSTDYPSSQTRHHVTKHLPPRVKICFSVLPFHQWSDYGSACSHQRAWSWKTGRIGLMKIVSRRTCLYVPIGPIMDAT